MEDKVDSESQSEKVNLTESCLSAIEAELRRWLDSRASVGRHYDLLAYHMGWLDESFQPTEGPRGKRFRPLLCLLSCQSVGGQWADALPLAAAIEFLHNFSLIHDDIEDHDEARHHRPSLWKLVGEPLAINAGDAMLALSGAAALTCRNGSEVASGLQETALELTEGQYLDMTFENQSVVSTQDYFRMIRLKTSALIAFSCQSGALLGGGKAEQAEALGEFGRHFGLAFQLFDDIRGIWAESAVTGKAEATDIVNRKKSLPVLLALDRATGTNHRLLDDYYAHRQQEEAATIRDIIDSLGVHEEAERAMHSHLREALSAIHSADMIHTGRSALIRLALTLVGSPQLAP